MREALAKAATFASSWVGESALEGAVLGLFDNFTLEDVYACIVGRVDVWTSDWGEHEGLRPQVLDLARNPKWRKHLDLLTTENVFDWLRGEDARPDVASLILNTPGGLEWLDRQIGLIRKALESVK